VWDATCVDTFSATNVCHSAVDAGFAATKAEEAKVVKYAALASSYIIQPVAFETSGVIGPSTTRFLRDIGGRLALRRNEPREAEWLTQRLSLAIIRGNALAIRMAGHTT
jgi:hypothetical protein